jgi:hypothetical protein
MRDEIYKQYDKFYNSDRSEFMVLYGVRRIGKHIQSMIISMTKIY